MSQEAADLTDQAAAELNEDLVPVDDVAELHAQLAAANRRAEENNDAFLRARADYQNLKRRTDEEKESMRSLMNADLLKRLLDVADNFERALRAAEQAKDYDKLVTGINAVYRQVAEFLAREGVTAIEALDEPFDPNLHNAVLREETTEYPENTVLEELQRGYLLNGKVLRPAMVKVSTGDA